MWFHLRGKFPPCWFPATTTLEALEQSPKNPNSVDYSVDPKNPDYSVDPENPDYSLDEHGLNELIETSMETNKLLGVLLPYVQEMTDILEAMAGIMKCKVETPTN